MHHQCYLMWTTWFNFLVNDLRVFKFDYILLQCFTCSLHRKKWQVKNWKKNIPAYPNFFALSLIFFGILVNGTFSNLKLNFFIITGFLCSNRYVKQELLINHSWISPTLQREWGLEFCLFRGRSRSNLWFLLIFVLINPRNIAIQGICMGVTSFNIYPNF